MLVVNDGARYIKTVEWSDEDQCFIGQCPGVVGTYCHGDNEAEVYAELCEIFDEWLEVLKQTANRYPRQLPAAESQKKSPDMRKHSFDFFEFEPPESEQFLDLAFASKRQYADLQEFLADCGALDESLRSSSGSGNWQETTEYVRAYLRKCLGIELPLTNGSQPTVLSKEWNDVEVSMETPEEFVWFHWWTTA